MSSTSIYTFLLLLVVGSAVGLPTFLTSPPFGQCGRSGGFHASNTEHIVGGTVAERNEFPWLASLHFEGDHSCGGSILNQHWILSAAHCFRDEGSNPRSWSVKVGKHSQFEAWEATSATHRVSKLIIHENYRPLHSAKNDIALMKLSQPIVFNQHVGPVCLAGKHDLKSSTINEGDHVLAVGWGTTSSGIFSEPSDVVRKVSIPVVGNRRCAEAYADTVIYSTMLCAGDLRNGGLDTCQGDSGGPLLHRHTNGSWVQVGITSWGAGCGMIGKPGIYTRIAEEWDWIWSHAGDS